MTSNDARIKYAAAHKVATITLDGPARRNALSTALIARVREALARAVADDAVRVVVIDHAGPVFSAGADLTESAAASGLDELPAAHLAELLADLCEAPKPVVAVAKGGAKGGGMGLLAAADIAICEAGASLAFSEVRLGVVPAVIAPVVARRLDPATMRRLFLTGERFDAALAEEWGLVSRAPLPEEVDACAAETVEHLLAGGPSAQAGIKKLTATPDLRERLREAAALTAEYFFSDEGAEGVRSFIEKRRPAWVD